MISIDQIKTAEQIDAVRGLVREFFGYALTLDPTAKGANTFAGLEEQLANLPGIFGPPEGAFLLATVGGAPAGCVAYFGHGNDVCEMKRMYVKPEFRGMKLGEKLTQSLIERARAQGHRKIVLSTFYKLETAQALYAKAGFTVCEPTEHVPEENSDKVIYMEMSL